MKKQHPPNKEETIILKICPECKHTNFIHDYIHKETYCTNCGLIILAPPSTEFITPGFEEIIVTVNLIPEETLTTQTRQDNKHAPPHTHLPQKNRIPLIQNGLKNVFQLIVP